MKKIGIVVAVVVVVCLIGAFSGGGTESTSNGGSDQSISQSSDGGEDQAAKTQSAAWDAGTALVGMTVESAWDEIEKQGYTLSGILSITGAELNSDESVRHSSTAQTWYVDSAEADDASKTVTITVTSRDHFVETHGEGAIK